MGVPASIGVLLDTASSLQSFVDVFVRIYILLILAWVILSWVRLPYSSAIATVQRFLDEVVVPYVRLFRRLPTLGPFDLSPIVAVIVLLVAAGLVNRLIGALL
ncbi:MAG: YggT family protein [Actinobacteria bacterium]|nr:YggT family protein [Actinomycetota bacterium]